VNDFEIFSHFTIFLFEMLATLAYNLIASSQAALKKIPFEKKNNLTVRLLKIFAVLYH